jgi:hypothetical protein
VISIRPASVSLSRSYPGWRDNRQDERSLISCKAVPQPHTSRTVHPARRAGRRRERNDSGLSSEHRVTDLSKEFAKAYGLTADQLIKKIRLNPSSSNLISYSLKEMNDAELIRLVTDCIPKEIADSGIHLDQTDVQIRSKNRFVRSICSVFETACCSVERFGRET